jgi:hypothetical protein
MTAVSWHHAPPKEGTRGGTMGSPTLNPWVEEGV